MIQINGSLASKLNKLLNKENDNLLFSEDELSKIDSDEAELKSAINSANPLG